MNHCMPYVHVYTSDIFIYFYITFVKMKYTGSDIFAKQLPVSTGALKTLCVSITQYFYRKGWKIADILVQISNK